MNRRTTSMLACAVITASPAFAAEVTPERLTNADREPQNWLMNHRTYDAQRYSPLDKINKANVTDLKLAYAVAIGGRVRNKSLPPTMIRYMVAVLGDSLPPHERCQCGLAWVMSHL